jgi:hypothetical protein
MACKAGVDASRKDKEALRGAATAVAARAEAVAAIIAAAAVLARSVMFISFHRLPSRQNQMRQANKQ